MSDFVCPEGARLIALGSKKHPGNYAIVDEYDFMWLNRYRWTYMEAGTHQKCRYAYRNATAQEKANGRPRIILMHREIMGDIGELHVDHINHNGLDNRRANLRAVTHAENMRNRRPPLYPAFINSECKVYQVKRRGEISWAAEIWIRNKRAAMVRRRDKASVQFWKREGEIIKQSVLSLF